MAGKRRRFSRLAEDLRKANGTVTDPKVSGYLNFLTKTPGSILKVSDTATKAVTDAGGLTQKSVGIHPFNFSAKGVVDADRRDARMSAASASRFKTNTLDKDYFGIKLETADVLAGFYPAKANIFVKGAGAATTPNSQITGAKYTRKPGASMGIPFGRSAKGINSAGAQVATIEECDEQEAKAGIIKYIATDKPNMSVSFASEIFYSVGTAKPIADL